MLRLAHPAVDHDADTEESVTVAEAARRLGCDDATVRALIRQGELTGHRIGKCANPRGIRVHAESVRDYKRRNAIGGTPANDAGRRRVTVHNTSARDAERRLRARGLIT